MRQALMIAIFLLCQQSARADACSELNRRAALKLAGSAAIGAIAVSQTVHAASGPPERQKLLQLIEADADENAILAAVAALSPLDPSAGKAATSEALDGEWELLWSANAQAFSPLLGLPRPIRPQSIQLLGAAAAAQVGAGRVANVLRLPLGVSFVLSSDVGPLGASEPATLEIAPPFRFEIGTPGGGRVRLVEAGSDAEFRALNARDAEAQAAPKNRYVQDYLEVAGGRGDIRISRVASGDPVIVGSIFVHRRL